MKQSPAFLFLILFSITTVSLVGQTPPEAVPESPTAPAATADNLDQERIQEIVKANEERRWTDVLQMTDGVAESDPTYLGLMNIRLSALVQAKHYDQALELLEMMSKAGEEESAEVHDFNYGEVYFLKKEYKKSIKYFERFLAGEGNEKNALARFKLYLGYLLDGQMGKADAMKSQTLPTISHPLFYYVQAASEFQAGNDDVARDWLKSSTDIYTLGLNVAFADAFKEIGWLEPHEVTGFPVLTQAQLKSLNAEFQPTTPKRPQEKKKSFFEGLLPSLGDDKKKK